MPHYIFESIMLLCFGASWPLSVFKMLKTKTSAGKSFAFLWLIFIGYISGICHKVFIDYNNVIWLYVFNCIIVFVDIMLCYKYRENKRKEIPETEKAPADIFQTTVSSLSKKK